MVGLFCALTILNGGIIKNLQNQILSAHFERKNKSELTEADSAKIK